MADEYQMEEGQTTELPAENPGEELIDVVEPSFAVEEAPEEDTREGEPQRRSRPCFVTSNTSGGNRSG